jgi:RNA ligase
MKQVLIKTIKKCNEPAFRYDISVAKNSNFFANDILVHNSLIIAFWYNDELVVSSRGSFNSPHAIEAKRLLNEKYPQFEYNMQLNLTYCFELIGFEQIVVKYPESDLVATGIFDAQGWEYDLYKSLTLPAAKMRVVKKYDGFDWKTIKNLNWENAEGFVVRFNTMPSGSRCKIKFDDYIRLHKIMTNISDRQIWEALKNGQSISSILENVPDEFFAEVRRVESNLIQSFLNLEADIRVRFEIERIAMHDRKSFAANIANYAYKDILFAMLDGKSYAEKIWLRIKP